MFLLLLLMGLTPYEVCVHEADSLFSNGQYIESMMKCSQAVAIAKKEIEGDPYTLAMAYFRAAHSIMRVDSVGGVPLHVGNQGIIGRCMNSGFLQFAAVTSSLITNHKDLCTRAWKDAQPYYELAVEFYEGLERERDVERVRNYILRYQLLFQ